MRVETLYLKEVEHFAFGNKTKKIQTLSPSSPSTLFIPHFEFSKQKDGFAQASANIHATLGALKAVEQWEDKEMAESMQEAFGKSGITGTQSTGGREQSEGVPGIFGSNINVGEAERWASAIGGGALALYGITRLITHGSWGGAVLALVGGSLIYRGTSGHCAMYEAAGINTAGTATPRAKSAVVSVPAERGIKVEKSTIINRSPAELYQFWRRFENLPRFMNHLESVTTSGNRSHWVAKAPAGSTVEWDAEIYNEKENELIAWRSLEGADVDNAGSVHFTPARDGSGTEVRVVLKYDPPGGVIGATLAKLFGEEPSQQIEEDLHRFKQLMETGTVPTTEGQPSGRSARAGR